MLLKINQLKINSGYCAPASRMNDTERYGIIEITNECNANCHFCYMSSKKVSCTSNQTNHGKVFSLINRMLYLKRDSIDSLSFVGGEPTTSPYLTLLLQVASELKFKKIIVHSNGLRLNQGLLDSFVKHSVKLTISIYGLNSEEADKVLALKGAHELVLKNAMRALDCGLHVHFCFVGNFENDAPLNHFVEENFRHQLGSISFSVHPVVKKGRAQDNAIGCQQEQCYCDNRVTYIDYSGVSRNCVFGV